MNTCYIIDDETFAIDVLRKYIAQTDELKLVGAQNNPILALDEVSKLMPNIVFLDINMPEISGLDAIDYLPESALVVFTTAHPKYALNAFDKYASAFLLKPFTFEKFSATIKRITSRNPTEKVEIITSKNLFINPGTKGKLIKVDMGEILYIEAEDHFVHIITQQEKIITKLGIKEVLFKLDSNFHQVHRSFIVNLLCVKLIQKNQLTLSNDIIIPFGDSYKKAFISALKC
jgi:two-component system LytT family response regulator